jgi:glutamine synthetase
MTKYTNQYSLKIAEPHNKYNKLTALQKHFKFHHALTPVVGAELEFYLSPGLDLAKLASKIEYEIQPEKGENQFEINFLPGEDLSMLAREIILVRSKITSAAEKLGGAANFNSKPFRNDYGSSMHIHLNFLEDNNIEKYANILCQYLNLHIEHCLPKSYDYKRLDSNFMAPTHISWGANNRTILIRIPDSLPKRLEHRLPSADSDPAMVIFSIINSINHALTSNEISLNKFEKIYGNAFDQQYNLQPIFRACYKAQYR